MLLEKAKLEKGCKCCIIRWFLHNAEFLFSVSLFIDVDVALYTKTDATEGLCKKWAKRPSTLLPLPGFPVNCELGFKSFTHY